MPSCARGWAGLSLSLILGSGCGEAPGHRLGDHWSGDWTGLPDASIPDWGTTDGGAACPAEALGASMGILHPLVGGRFEDDEIDQAPFDLRYSYLSGVIPRDGPCASCGSCSENNWWGCWQGAASAPGGYVRSRIESAEAAGAFPMFTYYVWHDAAGRGEGDPEVAALSDAETMTAYLRDWRFVCERVGEATTGPVILHVEPDLWGYVQQVSADPATVGAAVPSAGMTECDGLPGTAAGFARCLLAIARVHAPAALVGFHASAFGAGRDALHEDGATFDVVPHADATAAFIRALGGAEADLVVVEMSDADAGRDGRWWDPTNTTRPNFNQALTWTARVGASLGLPYLFWQVPLGNPDLDDVCTRYRDNRVDYYFDHAGDFAATGMLGIAFGDAGPCATTVQTDGGHFFERARAHLARPGGSRPCLCGASCRD